MTFLDTLSDQDHDNANYTQQRETYELVKVSKKKTIKGLLVGTTNEGIKIYEELGTGRIFKIKDKPKLKRTVAICFFNGINKGKPYSYFCDNEDLKEGDLLFINKSFAVVDAVDTNSDKATAELRGFKVQAEIIK